jgi:ribosomal protein L16 Arg81 hydroxylase
MAKSISASDVTVSHQAGYRDERIQAESATPTGSAGICEEIQARKGSADRSGDARTIQPLPVLARLVHPIDVAEFQRDHWNERPLVVHRGDRNYFSDLLTLDDMDQILSLSDVNDDNVRLANNSRTFSVKQLVSASSLNANSNLLEQLYARYRSGWTVQVKAIEWRWEPLRHFTTALGAEIGARVRANLYLTPAASQAFPAHYDTHDVFIVQVHGSKHWRLATNPYRLPLPDQGYGAVRVEPEPEQEFDLSAGDVLYMPRGTIHWATSQETASLHITVSVHPVLYAQALQSAIGKIFNSGMRFREALPLGFAADEDGRREAAAQIAELLSVLGERLSPRDILEESAKHAASASLPTLRHHLTDLEELDGVRIDTPVRRRPGQQWLVSTTGDAVNVHFHNKSIRLPAHLGAEIRFITESDGFAASDIPGALDESGRLFLITTFLREGFLTLGHKDLASLISESLGLSPAFRNWVLTGVICPFAARPRIAKYHRADWS